MLYPDTADSVSLLSNVTWVSRIEQDSREGLPRQPQCAAGAWFDAFLQGDSDTLPVIAIAAGDGLNRAVLVTTSGTYDLRR